MTERDPAQARLLTPAYRRLFVATMFLVCFFNFADRAVFSVLAQTIKADLRLTDFQLGLLQGLAFALLYAAVGLPIGRLAERASRLRIVAAATAFWSLATVASGLAAGFVQLMLARLAVGMGEAGFTPPTSSLVSDLVPRNRRASTLSLIMLGTPAGLFLGSVVAGWVAQHYGWRASFLALGLPGLLVAALVVAVLREPDRGLAEGAPPDKRPAPPFREFLRTLGGNRSLKLVIAGGALAGFGMTSISQFLAVFLARVHQMKVGEAAAFYGGISGLALAIGLIAGSFGTDFLSRRDPRWPAWGAAIGLGFAPFLYWFAFAAESRFAAAVLLVSAGATLMLFFGPTGAMIQNLLPPRMRATGAALYTMLYTMIGAGLGPTFVGFVSDRLAARAFAGDYAAACPGGLPPAGAAADLAGACARASAGGVQQALMVSVSVFFLSALLFLLAARTLRADFYDSEAAQRNA
jgi:predicted MFS family arabinose efflux permease